MNLLLIALVFILVFILLSLLILYKIGFFHAALLKVDRESPKHGGELVAEVLKAHGVKFLFTLTGGHISPILVASESIGIRVVDTRHEATAVFAADAVARLTGNIGVAAVTAGPGLTNTITAVKNAQMAESPVLLISGAAATLLKGRGALQDIDQMSLLKSLCKYTSTVNTIRHLKDILRKAIQVSLSGTPGPVFVELPINILYPYKVVSQELNSGRSAGKGLIMKLINFYLQTHLDNLFAGAFEKRTSEPLPVHVDQASDEQIQKCVEIISKSKRPVMVLGSQSVLTCDLIGCLASSLESLRIPCFLGGMSRGLLGQKSTIQFRHCRKIALKESDCIILAGTVCDFRLSYGRILNRKSKIIAINRSRSQLLKNSDLFWKPYLHLQCDAANALVRVSEKLKGFKCSPDWLSYLRSADDTKEAQNLEMSKHETDNHLNPIKVLQELEKVLPEKSILIADGGDFVGTAAYILRPRGPLTWLDPGAFGTLGVGGGFALGAKLCYPDHDVWVLYGDGSLGFSVAEFDTFTRHKLPVIALVGNDACWSQIARDQIRILGLPTACNLAFCKYELVAQGFGGCGQVLNRENESEIGKVFMEAQTKSRQGSSVLINCFIGKTSFRDGSISV